MKVTQSVMMGPELAKEVEHLGALLVRLRHARGMKQQEAALRAGMSRNSAYRLERGDPGLAIGQILRYLEAIAPGKTLLELLSQTDPALVTLGSREKKRRVRDMTRAELDALDF
jgi:transcriptional regulator with XRE-family HTH domain